MILVGKFDNNTDTYKIEKKATQADFVAFSLGMQFSDGSAPLNRSEAAKVYNDFKKLPYHLLIAKQVTAVSSKRLRVKELTSSAFDEGVVLVIECTYHHSDSIRVPFVEYAGGTEEELLTAQRAAAPFLRAEKIKRI